MSFSQPKSLETHLKDSINRELKKFLDENQRIVHNLAALIRRYKNGDLDKDTFEKKSKNYFLSLNWSYCKLKYTLEEGLGDDGSAIKNVDYLVNLFLRHATPFPILVDELNKKLTDEYVEFQRKLFVKKVNEFWNRIHKKLKGDDKDSVFNLISEIANSSKKILPCIEKLNEVSRIIRKNEFFYQDIGNCKTQLLKYSDCLSQAYRWHIVRLRKNKELKVARDEVKREKYKLSQTEKKGATQLFDSRKAGPSPLVEAGKSSLPSSQNPAKPSLRS